MKRALVCAVLFAAACKEQPVASSAPAASTPPASTTTQAASTQPPGGGAEALVPRVTSADLQKMIQSGDAVIIDVRQADNYTAAHIPGSLHIPLSFIDQEAAYLPRGNGSSRTARDPTKSRAPGRRSSSAARESRT